MSAVRNDPEVLAVDDEKQIRRALCGILENRGFRVKAVPDAASAIQATLEHTPDIIVLDLTLPDMDGLELCSRLRSWLDVPILVLSVRDSESDKIQALETGADDYLTKPFSAGELVARVRALLRRANDAPDASPVVEFGPYRLDVAGHRLTKSGEHVMLTPTEFDILTLLARNVNRVVTRGQIIDMVWGPGCFVDERTLRVHVSNLRKKLEPHVPVPQYVMTEPGVGYRLTVP